MFLSVYTIISHKLLPKNEVPFVKALMRIPSSVTYTSEGATRREGTAPPIVKLLLPLAHNMPGAE